MTGIIHRQFLLNCGYSYAGPSQQYMCRYGRSPGNVPAETGYSIDSSWTRPRSIAISVTVATLAGVCIRETGMQFRDDPVKKMIVLSWQGCNTGFLPGHTPFQGTFAGIRECKSRTDPAAGSMHAAKMRANNVKSINLCSTCIGILVRA